MAFELYKLSQLQKEGIEKAILRIQERDAIIEKYKELVDQLTTSLKQSHEAAKAIPDTLYQHMHMGVLCGRKQQLLTIMEEGTWIMDREMQDVNDRIDQWQAYRRIMHGESGPNKA